MTNVLIIQARTGSTRLPGKVLRMLHGAPMLARQIERVRAAKRVDTIIVATTDTPQDDSIADLAEDLGAGVFRGDEKDVLDRFYQAAKGAGADTVIRITGDCPLHDPKVIDQVIGHLENAPLPLNYTSTPRNYPEGLDCEAFAFSSLEAAWEHAALPSEREHVTPYIKNHPERFVSDTWTSGVRDDSSMHWSVDTEADFRFVEAVYGELYDADPSFGTEDVLALLARKPELLRINAGGTGYEGLAKSLEEDQDFRTAPS